MVEIVSEIEAIQKYLEKRGSNVSDVIYYFERQVWTGAGDTIFGVSEGYLDRDAFLFGNLNISIQAISTITLTDPNFVDFSIQTRLKGRDESSSRLIQMGINDGMSILGSGIATGTKRIYGVGFNRIFSSCYFTTPGSCTTAVVFNGYLFIMR